MTVRDPSDPCPHGPDDPCTCDGNYADGTPGCCEGYEVGCCCDIDWDFVYGYGGS